MMERMLCNIPHPQPGSFPDCPFLWHHFSHEDLDCRGLPSTVCADHCYPARLGACQIDVHNCRLILAWVRKCHIAHPEYNLAAALDTLQRPRLRECKLHGLVGQLEVGFLFRVLLHELSKTLALYTFEGLQLAVLEINNVRAHLVE